MSASEYERLEQNISTIVQHPSLVPSGREGEPFAGKALSRESRVTHAALVALAVKTLRDRYDIVATEFSPYKQAIAFDFIGFSRHNKEIRIIECKTSRQDFLADNKWHRYLPYCTHLAFLGSKEAFAKAELPEKIGIIRPRVRTLPNGTEKLEWYYERGCRRLHEVGDYEYLTILEGFVGCYSRCLWTCRKWREKQRQQFGEEW